MNSNYDVIVAGAGIAGLLLASELSKSYKVLVLESSDKLNTQKFWVTTEVCVHQNRHLEASVDCRFTQMDFTDAYRQTFQMTGSYVLWDTHKLMNTLRQEIISNDSDVKFSNRFCGYRYDNDSIMVFANQHSYRSKLLCDCMGYQSPLVLSKDLASIKGYYTLYGRKLRMAQPTGPVALSNVVLNAKPRYLEIFPTASGHVNAVLIQPSESVSSYESLVNEFDFLVNSSSYSKHFDLTKPSSTLKGIIPVGQMKKRALDRIFVFGESAQTTPAATGTGLTRLLLGYQNTADYLSKLITSNKLTEKTLAGCPPIIDDFVRKVQLNIFDNILRCNSDGFSEFIHMLDSIDNHTVNQFVFGDLRKQDVLNKRNITELLHPTNRKLIWPIVKSLLQ
jgi:flavin-dependent dehydrogenase